MPVWNQLFKKWVTKSFYCLFFPAFTVWSPSSYWGPNSSFRQIVGGSFVVPYCLELLLPFPLWPYSSATRGRFDSLWEINFHIWSIRVFSWSCKPIYCQRSFCLQVAVSIPKHNFPLGIPSPHILPQFSSVPLKSLMPFYKIVVHYKWLYNKNQCWSIPDHCLPQNLLYNHLSIKWLFFLFRGNVEVYYFPRSMCYLVN